MNQLTATQQLDSARRKAEVVKKLLMLAELVASDGCRVTYQNMRIDGPMVPYHGDTVWTKEMLWAGRKTINLALIVEPVNDRPQKHLEAR